MKKILVFSGTTEGRKLAELLAKHGILVTVCVATEYGEIVMQNRENIQILTGRMSLEEMQNCMMETQYCAVVDATHPYATFVSENIENSAKKTGHTYIRLQRNTDSNQDEQIRYYSSHEACAKELQKENGSVLLTTGSKDLSAYCKEDSLKERIFARILPAMESLQICNENGLKGNQILALQGPFTQELNESILRQYRIQHLVTKESGATGGFFEKVRAAKKLDVVVHVIGNPERKNGYSFLEVVKLLEGIVGQQLIVNKNIEISLVGVGMGTERTLTREAKEVIERADYVFGSQRVIAPYVNTKQTYPYYLEKDIIPMLTEWEQECMSEDIRVVVLFSGDSGFFSGCENLYASLKEWGKDKCVSVRIYPGISSVSYLSAACGKNWQDAKIISVHGKGEQKQWLGMVRDAVLHNEKTFLLVSSVKDLAFIGQLLSALGEERFQLCVGYQLSYPEEEIIWCTPKSCDQFEKEGLYCCLIMNETPEKRLLSPGSRDEEFLRKSIPMTKEEIRQLVLCKLRLLEDSVVYDIGSGTGSVSVDVAKMSDTISVYAIEQKEEAVELTKENVTRAGVSNVTVVQGTAPKAFKGLPIATHAFVGGSNGNLSKILRSLYQINPSMRIVLTAVSLETMVQVNEELKKHPIGDAERVIVQISRAKQAGQHNLMQAENPIFMVTFSFTDQTNTGKE